MLRRRRPKKLFYRTSHQSDDDSSSSSASEIENYRTSHQSDDDSSSSSASEIENYRTSHQSDDDSSRSSASEVSTYKDDDLDDSFREKDSVDNDERMTGNAIKRSIRNHSRFQLNGDDEEETASQTATSTHNSSGRLPPWTSSQCKKRIIIDLKNDESSIHGLVATNWHYNLDKLWKKYAPEYQRSKFKGYMNTIMESYKAKKGVFKEGYVYVDSSDPTPLTSWDKSSNRKRIVKDLRDYRSSIHGLVKDWEKDDNLKKLWQEYAPEYQLSKFKGYMKTLMQNFNAKKGEFKSRWYAKTNGRNSDEYELLCTLFMNGDIAGVSRTLPQEVPLFFISDLLLLQFLQMSVEKVHSSHPLFAQYPLQEFKQHYDNGESKERSCLCLQ